MSNEPELSRAEIFTDENIDATVSDRRELQAFAAFLRYAGPRDPSNPRTIRVHPEWHAWLHGKGPCPNPDSEVGPDAVAQANS